MLGTRSCLEAARGLEESVRGRAALVLERFAPARTVKPDICACSQSDSRPESKGRLHAPCAETLAQISLSMVRHCTALCFLIMPLKRPVFLLALDVGLLL